MGTNHVWQFLLYLRKDARATRDRPRDAAPLDPPRRAKTAALPVFSAAPTSGPSESAQALLRGAIAARLSMPDDHLIAKGDGQRT
jgi:hypothetical protein